MTGYYNPETVLQQFPGGRRLRSLADELAPVPGVPSEEDLTKEQKAALALDTEIRSLSMKRHEILRLIEILKELPEGSKLLAKEKKAKALFVATSKKMIKALEELVFVQMNDI